jgi:hypothetical protein
MNGIIGAARSRVTLCIAGIGALTLGGVLLLGRITSSSTVSDAAATTPRVAAASTTASAGAALPAGVGQDWWSSVQKEIATSEYHVTPVKPADAAGTVATSAATTASVATTASTAASVATTSAYQAPNRAQNLRTMFGPEGITIEPRTGDGASWQWGLTLQSYGLGESSHEVEAATQVAEGNRIEYRRGALTEWYVNDERGLEQGFTIQAPPNATTSAGEPRGESNERSSAAADPSATRLHLDLTVTGSLTPALTDDGHAVDLIADGGARVLRYAELKVVDATGKELPASMELSGCDGASESGDSCTLRLLTDTEGAEWPITIDPLATSPNWTSESNQTDARFGACVAAAGDVDGDGYGDVILSASSFDNGHADEGRVYLFRGSASGLSTGASWTGEGNQTSARFGSSVASAGDVNGDGYADVIVGARDFDNDQTDEGRAFVFHGSASGLTAAVAWSAESNVTGSWFANSVASAGDVNGDGYGDVIIGAPNMTNGQLNEGLAFVYHGSASGLAASASWTGEINHYNGNFGVWVASAGDVNGDGYGDVIVGAPYSSTDQASEGQTYVYYGSATGLPASASWWAEGNQSQAYFGMCVAPAGDVNGDGYADVIIGADGYDNEQADEGRAFVYHGSATGLSVSPAWTTESNQTSSRSSRSVASAGDVNGDGYADVIVGAWQYTNDQSQEGRALVYFGSGVGLSASPTWTGEGDQIGASFGLSVASAGDVNGDGYSDVIVGAPSFDNVEANEGRAFVFYGGASNLSATANWTAESNQGGANFGASVASAGDVNGDGYGDVVVGAPGFDGGEENEGRAFVYHGSGSGLSPSATWTAESNLIGGALGVSVASAGDVNGDGYGDLIVGAAHYLVLGDPDQNDGRAYVYHGSASGLSASIAWSAASSQLGEYFARSVASAGDVNGDGYADVIIGAWGYDNGYQDLGRALVFLGSTAGLHANAIWTIQGDLANTQLGYSVASAGDVNGDGFSDVIVGEPGYSSGLVDQGKISVFHGSPSGLPESSSWSRASGQANCRFGVSVASAGDVNADGYADAIAGAPQYIWTGSQEGTAVVYPGSASGLGVPAIGAVRGGKAGALFGCSVASAGDVNGDGFADVVVGAEAYRNQSGTMEVGGAFLYYGSGSGLETDEAWSAEGTQPAERHGGSVASAGDVNGDGFADIIIGAYYHGNGQDDEGRAFVFYGNAGTGRPVLAQQPHGAGSPVLVQPWGSSGDTDDFAVRARHTSPFGRERVKLEVEACPSGVPFGHASCTTVTTPSWTDTTASPGGVELAITVSGLTTGSLYRWRERTLRAPYNISKSGITAPPHPEHGPWRRLGAQAVEADIRVPCLLSIGAAGSIIPAAGGSGTITVTTSAGCQWAAWSNDPWITVDSGSPGSGNGTVGYTVAENTGTARAGSIGIHGEIFTVNQLTSTRTLSVSRTGSGNGTVTSSPSGISCGSTCSASFDYNATVTLTANPAAGSIFTGWSGAGCSGRGTCVVTMTEARSVIADFTPGYMLTVSKTGASTGAVSSAPSGISCGATCAYGFATGTVVTLSATADPTANFAGWTGEGCSGLGTCQVTMSAARSVQAMFITKTATGFVPIAPCRLIDTRVSDGPSAGAPVLAPQSRRVFSLQWKCGLVVAAKAISGNITVVAATAQGHLQVLGGHLTSTNTSQLSIPLTRARANNALVQLSTDGLQTISVINPTTGSVHFILDINGYFL